MKTQLNKRFLKNKEWRRIMVTDFAQKVMICPVCGWINHKWDLEHETYECIRGCGLKPSNETPDWW